MFLIISRSIKCSLTILYNKNSSVSHDTQEISRYRVNINHVQVINCCNVGRYQKYHLAIIIIQIITIFDIITIIITQKFFGGKIILSSLRVFTWSGFKRLRNGSTTRPSLLNILSDRTLVPGTHRYFLAKLNSNGNMLLLLFHQTSTMWRY